MPHDYSEMLGATRRRQWGVCLAIFLLVLASNALGELGTQDSGRISAIWIANGLVLGLLLAVPRAHWYGYLTAAFLGNAAAHFYFGAHYPIALALALCNVGEVALAAGLIRKFSGDRIHLSQWSVARNFLLFGVVLAPLASGLVAASYLSGIQEMSFGSVVWIWFASHGLGIGIVCPLMLTWIQEGLPPRRNAVASDWWSPVALVAVTVGVFMTDMPQLAFLVLLPLIVVVFRHSHFGAVCGVGLIAGIGVPLTLMGNGPFALTASSDLRIQIVLLQAFIAVSSLMALGAALVLKQRRTVASQLEQAHYELQMITDNVSALIARVDVHERLQFVNESLCKAYSRSKDELLGMSIEDLVGSYAYKGLKPHIDKVLSGEVEEFEIELPSPLGNRRHRVSYVPERTEGGAVVGFYASTIDMTDLREAESRVERSERWLQNFADNMPGLAAYIGRNERFSFANQQFKKVLGLDPDTLIGQSLASVIGRRRHEAFAPQLEQVFRGRHVQFETDVELDAETQHFLCDLVPDINPQGRVIGVFASAANITARKNSELRQAASEARIRTVTDGLPGLISYLDRNGIVRFSNGAYQDWFGIPSAHMVGKTMDEALGAIFTQSQEPFVAKALLDERVETEFEAEAKGRRRFLQATYLPHRDETGRVLGVYTLASDITPLKRMQSELTQMARYDTLTGLCNRGEFNLRLAETLRRSAEEGQSVSLMFIDVDHFKEVNDTHGHATGDAVLQEVAGRLKGCINAPDTVARLAGDEFVIILESLESLRAAEYVARDILSAMSAPVIFGDSEVQASLSIGIAHNPIGSEQASELLANADKALYQAKAAGRATYRVHGLEAAARSSERKTA